MIEFFNSFFSFSLINNIFFNHHEHLSYLGKVIENVDTKHQLCRLFFFGFPVSFVFEALSVCLSLCLLAQLKEFIKVLGYCTKNIVKEKVIIVILYFPY